MTNNDKDFEMCFRVENVFLPKNGHFGLSAATGGLADDHDVIHFLTSSLHSGDPAQTGSQSKSNKIYDAFYMLNFHCFHNNYVSAIKNFVT